MTIVLKNVSKTMALFVDRIYIPAVRTNQCVESFLLTSLYQILLFHTLVQNN